MSEPVVSLVIEAAEEFFRSAGIVNIVNLGEGTSVTFEAESDLLSSALGFSGEKIKAALIVECKPSAVAATNPLREMKKDLDISDHTDWIGEIANQIVGNLKRILRSYGVDCTMGTPVVTAGKGFHLVSSSKVYKVVTFSVDGQILKINFNLQLASDVDLQKKNDDLKDEVSAGDAFLF